MELLPGRQDAIHHPVDERTVTAGKLGDGDRPGGGHRLELRVPARPAPVLDGGLTQRDGSSQRVPVGDDRFQGDEVHGDRLRRLGLVPPGCWAA